MCFTGAIFMFRIVLYPEHAMGIDVKLLCDESGDMTGAASDRHFTVFDIGNHNDHRPYMHQAFIVPLFEVIDAEPAFSTTEFKLAAPSSPGVYIIVNQHQIRSFRSKLEKALPCITGDFISGTRAACAGSGLGFNPLTFSGTTSHTKVG